MNDHLLSHPYIQLLHFFVDYPPLISSANCQSSVALEVLHLRYLKEVEKHIVDQGIVGICEIICKRETKRIYLRPFSRKPFKTKQIQQPVYNVAHNDLQQLHYFNATFILLKCLPLYCYRRAEKRLRKSLPLCG